MLTPLYDWLGKRSYSQSGEDLIADLELFGQKKGFYVDVGAYHPKLFSNTYLFYKRGWKGVCIDPNPALDDMFMSARPRDLFLNLGVAEHDDVMEYVMFDDGAANTFVAEQSRRNVKLSKRKITGKKLVPLIPLHAILDEYLSKGQKVDLLSVDVEGMDLSVLRSNNWKKYSPKVVICEDLDFDFGNLQMSPVVKYMSKMGYMLSDKTPYSLIFVKKISQKLRLLGK